MADLTARHFAGNYRDDLTIIVFVVRVAGNPVMAAIAKTVVPVAVAMAVTMAMPATAVVTTGPRIRVASTGCG